MMIDNNSAYRNYTMNCIIYTIYYYYLLLLLFYYYLFTIIITYIMIIWYKFIKYIKLLNLKKIQ